MSTMNKTNNIKTKHKEDDKNFSKNSVLTIAKKAGIKSITQCGIEKSKEVLLEKIKNLSERFSHFLKNKNGKTVNKKIILDFLQSEGINVIDHRE